jgi:outer membrane protein with beta-barrel domain
MRRAGVLLSLLLAGTRLDAQTPRAELSAEYAFTHDVDRDEDSPYGWVVSAIGNINGWMGIATEFSGAHRTCEACQRGPFDSQRLSGTNLDIHVYTFMAGPRLAARAFSTVTPFAQVLVGGSHVGGGIQWDGALNTGLTYQPGGGVDITMTRAVGVRLQADYRVIRTQGRHNKQTRVAGGLVWRFGEFTN